MKIGNSSFKIGCYTAVLIFSGLFPFPLRIAPLLFRRIFDITHAIFQRFLINAYGIVVFQDSKTCTKYGASNVIDTGEFKEI